MNSQKRRTLRQTLYLLLSLTVASSYADQHSLDADTLRALKDELARTQQHLEKLEKKQLSDQLKFHRWKQRLNFNGFLSAGVIRSDDENFYLKDGVAASASITDRHGHQFLNKVGVQLDFQVSDDIKVVSQFLARGVNNYDTDTEWAYFSWSPSDALEFRAGRLRYPYLYHSESLDVGYSYPSVRLPAETYSATQISAFDGFDILYRTTLADREILINANWGSSSIIMQFSSEIPFTADDLLSFSITALDGPWTAQVGYTLIDMSLPFSELEGIPELAGALGVPLPTFDTEDARTETFYAALLFDNDNWFLTAEATTYHIASILTNGDAYSFTIGKRMGKFTPYATVSQANARDNDERILTAHPSSVAATALGITSVDFGKFAIESEQKTYTLGLRYDVKPGIALKLQAEHITDFKGTLGLFQEATQSNPLSPVNTGSFDRYGSVNVYSFVIDTVF